MIVTPGVRYRAAVEQLQPVVYLPCQGRFDDGVRSTAGQTAAMFGRVYPNASWLDEDYEPPTELGRYLTTYLHIDDQDAGLSLEAMRAQLSTMARGGQWTYTGWHRPDGTGYKQTITVLNSTAGHLSLHWASDGQGIWAEDANGHNVQGRTAASLVGRWSFVAMTVDGTRVTLYVDGVQVGTGTLDAWPALDVSSALLLSMGRAGGANCTFGSHTQMAFHGRALAASEIARLHDTGRHVAASGSDPAYWLPETGESANFGGTQSYYSWPHEGTIRNPDFPRMAGWFSSANQDKPAAQAEQLKSHRIAAHGNSDSTRLADFVTGGFNVWPDYAALFPEVAADESARTGLPPTKQFLDATNPPAKGWDLITVSDEWDTFEPRVVNGQLVQQWDLKKQAVETYTAKTGRRAYVNEGVGVTFGAHNMHDERKFFAGISGYSTVSCDLYCQCLDADMAIEMKNHGFPTANPQEFRRPDMYSRFSKRIRGMLDRPMVVYGAVANGHANMQRAKGPKSAPTPREFEASCIASYLGGATGILVFPESYASDADRQTAAWSSTRAYVYGEQVRRDTGGKTTYWVALRDVQAGTDPATSTPNLYWVRWRETGSGDTSNASDHAIGMPEATQRAFRVQAAKSRVLQADGRYRVRAHPDLSAMAIDAFEGRGRLVVLQKWSRTSGTYTIQLPASAAGKTITVEHMTGTDATATRTADANARITETFDDPSSFFWYSWPSTGAIIDGATGGTTTQPTTALDELIQIGDSLSADSRMQPDADTFISSRFTAQGFTHVSRYAKWGKYWMRGRTIAGNGIDDPPTTEQVKAFQAELAGKSRTWCFALGTNMEASWTDYTAGRFPDHQSIDQVLAQVGPDDPVAIVGIWYPDGQPTMMQVANDGAKARVEARGADKGLFLDFAQFVKDAGLDTSRVGKHFVDGTHMTAEGYQLKWDWVTKTIADWRKANGAGTPVDPAPVDPTPDPTPVDPTPVDPGPTPVDPVPTDPEPVPGDPDAVAVISGREISGWRGRVTVQLSGRPRSNVMTITRQLPDGTSAPILAGNKVHAASGSWDDPEVPLGVPVVYVLTIKSQTWTSQPVTVRSDRPVVSDPYRGWQVQAIRSAQGLERTTAARASAIDVAGRRDRVIVWDVESGWRSSPRFITTSRADEATFDQIMASGAPFLVRYPCPDLESGWLARTGGRTKERLGRRGAMAHTLADCEHLPGALTPDQRPDGDTLGDLHVAVGGDGVGTLEVIATRWATLGAIAATDLKALA